MRIVGVERRVYLATIALAGLLAAAWAYAGPSGPSGPSVTGGKNPLVTLHAQVEVTVQTAAAGTFWASAKANLIEVPQGRTFVLREMLTAVVPPADGKFVAPKPIACKVGHICIVADGAVRHCGTALSLNTGLKFAAGTKIELQIHASYTDNGSSTYHGAHKCGRLITVNGYLLRP